MRFAALFASVFSFCSPESTRGVGTPSTNLTRSGCHNTVIRLVEDYYGVSSIEGVALKLLGDLQDECTSSKCQREDIRNDCKNQSINDINCEMKQVFSTGAKLFPDSICNTGCNDWPCRAGCEGIDAGICYGSDWLLCKAGCLGMSSCVHACEHTIVDPCKRNIIDQCNETCERTFNQCKVACQRKLSMNISADFERMQRMVTSMNVSSLDVNCSGNAITSAVALQAEAALGVSNAALSFKVHIADVGISTTSVVNLQNISLTLAVPISGSLSCGFFHDKVNLTVGEVRVTGFGLDVDLELDEMLETIASVICLDVSLCKNAVKTEIASIVKDEIMKQVPSKVAPQVQPVLQKLASKLHCPKIGKTIAGNADAKLRVVV